MEVKRLERPVSVLFKDPVMGRTFGDGEAAVYVHVLKFRQPEWLTRLVERHEAGHLAGLVGGFRLSVMFEAPGRIRDTLWEKLLTVAMAPAILAAVWLRGDWLTQVERDHVETAYLARKIDDRLYALLG